MNTAAPTPTTSETAVRPIDVQAADAALSDGRSRRARLVSASVAIATLAVIWTACAALRDDAAQKLAARAAATASGTGLAARAAAPGGREVHSHFPEFVMISFGVVAIGILLAFMGTDVLGPRLRAVRDIYARRTREWMGLVDARDAAMAKLVRLLNEQHAALRSVVRLGRVAPLQAALEIEQRAAAQLDVYGYWGPAPKGDEGDDAPADDDGSEDDTPAPILRTDADIIAEAARLTDVRDDLPAGPRFGQEDNHNNNHGKGAPR